MGFSFPPSPTFLEIIKFCRENIVFSTPFPTLCVTSQSFPHFQNSSVGGGGVLPFTRVDFVTLYQSKNVQLLLISIFCYYNFCLLSDPVKQNLILDQFSIITKPYPRVNGLKTIPFPTRHTHIANIWEYPLPPRTLQYLCIH